jgi:hypothetical protein
MEDTTVIIEELYTYFYEATEQSGRAVDEVPAVEFQFVEFAAALSIGGREIWNSEDGSVLTFELAVIRYINELEKEANLLKYMVRPAFNCEAGIHSWVGEPEQLSKDTPCKLCGEQYGDVS